MIIFVILFSFLLISCSSSTVVIPFDYDVALCSDYSTSVINGKQLHPKLGLGGVSQVDNKKYTYPVAYLGSNYSISSKDAIALGGLEISKIDPTFKKVKLKFFINYKDVSRKNVMLFVRPILTQWNQNDTTFNFFYKYDEIDNEYILTENVVKDEQKCVLVLFDIKANENKNYAEIPFKSAYRTVVIDITKIIRYWIEHQSEYYGLLLDPMWQTDWRYCTTNVDKEVCDTGILEVATTDWYTWNDQEECSFLYMQNKSLGNIKYCPRIEIEY